MTSEEDVKKLFVKTEERTIGGVKFTIKQMSLDEISLGFDQTTPPEERAKRMVTIISRSTGLSAETIRQISMEHFLELQEAILEVNGLTDEKFKKLVRLRSQMEGTGG